MSYLVIFEDSEAKPRFANRCIACGDDRPNSEARFVAREFHPTHLALLFCFGKRTELDVPMCQPCEDAYRTSRRARLIATIAGIVAAAGVAAAVVPLVEGPWRSLVPVALVLAALSTPILWKAFAPFALDPTRTRDGLQFDFRDEETAADFASLNDAEVVRR